MRNLFSKARLCSAFWERVFPQTGCARRLVRWAQTRSFAALSAGVMLVGCAAPAAPADYYTEPFRPRFHFTPERNWMNDPNGMVFYEGEYHLFYQYNPFGDKWGHMSWGHAVSPDMVRWEHLPVALAEEDGVMIFSGSAVVDWQNSSRFGKDGKPPLVAIYTGHYTEKPLQNQHLAYSNDKGRTWTKYADNPVLDIGARDFRDPKVMWHEPTRRWIMTVVLATEHKVRFYGSPNLKEWTLLSEFGPVGATGGVWECPDLFELPVEGTGEKRWVLVVNLNPGSVAGGSGGQYFIGQFDGTRFVADKDSLGQSTPEFVPDGNIIADAPARSASESALWFDYGPDFYAAVSWSDIPKSDGRRLWLGWMSNWDYAQDVPTSPWRSAMSIPREVGLRRTAEGVRLMQRPVRELKTLRGQHWKFSGGDIAGANGWLAENQIAGEQLEIKVEFAAASHGAQGLKVLQAGKQATAIGVDHARGKVFVDRTRSGNVSFHPKFPGVYEAPLTATNRPVTLHAFVDAGSVEVFVNNGEQVFTALVFPSSKSPGIEFFGPVSGANINSINAWKLKSCW